MNTAGKIAVVFGLLCITSGCRHTPQATPPPAAQAPIASPAEVAKGTLPPPLPPAKPLDVKPPEADDPQDQPPPKPHKAVRHKTKPADASQPAKDPATAQATQQASAGEPPEMSPIGQLSSSGTSSGAPNRHQIQDLISNTENGLNGIKRTLSVDEQLTVTQIRTFLKKARQALDQDDLDGANTLATKAKVLMDELTKS